LSDAPGHEKRYAEGRNGGTRLNGPPPARVKTDTVEMEIEVPQVQAKSGTPYATGFDRHTSSLDHPFDATLPLALPFDDCSDTSCIARCPDLRGAIAVPSIDLRPAGGRGCRFHRASDSYGHVPQAGRGRTQEVAPASKAEGAAGIWVTHHPLRSALKEVAFPNMLAMSVTLLTSHAPSGWSKPLVLKNMNSIVVTLPTSHVSSVWLKAVASLNMSAMAVTLPTSHVFRR